MPLASAGDFYPDRDPFLLKEWTDVKNGLQMPGFTGKYAILKYVFSEQEGGLFYILGNGADLYFGKVTDEKDNVIGSSMLLAWDERYRKHFIHASNEADTSLHQEMATGYFEIWRDLFELLLKPVMGIRGGLPYKEVFYQCKINIDGQRITFNLSLLYDLHFLYANRTVNEPLYFSHVSDENIASYFPVIECLPCPLLNQMVMLNGNRNLYASIKNSEKYTEEQKQRVKVRENLFSRAMAFFESGGGQYMSLESVEQFEELLSVKSEKQVLQLFAHYQDGRLFTAESYIKLKKLQTSISNMNNNGHLRSDAIIDVSTCNNFADFQVLKGAGIQYMYYRHHNITTDLAVLNFLELYSGFVAKQLNWDFPYIDGKTHLHVIYSKINRAFYACMNSYNEIKIPDIWKE